MRRFVILVLLAATTAPSCSGANPVTARRVIATPIVTSAPTPRPTAKAPPSPPRRSDAVRSAVAETPTHAAIVATIERVFGPTEGLIAVNVADCESGDGPNVAPGPPYDIDPKEVYAGNVGAFQIHLVDHEDAIARHGFTDADMTRIEPNTIVAKDIYDRDGWGPWSCKTHAVAA